MKSSRSFVWLLVFGVVALFALATPDITDTAFDEVEAPLTASFAALPQARLQLPMPAMSPGSHAFGNFLKISNSLINSRREQDPHRAPTADLQKLLCVFLI